MIEVLNCSIAVSAEAHNPSILHPSFLTSQQIVPGDWALDEPPLCTPALAAVKFANGISIAVDLQKLQVVDNKATTSNDLKVPGIIQRYTAKLPYVRYTGVGLNFTGFIETADAEAMLRQLIAPGPWNDADLPLESAGLRLVYSALDSRLRLAMDSGTAKHKEQPARKGLVVAANYHVDTSGDDAVAKIAAFANRMSACRDHFVATVARLFPES
jgi:hypothetical protein